MLGWHDFLVLGVGTLVGCLINYYTAVKYTGPEFITSTGVDKNNRSTCILMDKSAIVSTRTFWGNNPPEVFYKFHGRQKNDCFRKSHQDASGNWIYRLEA